MRAEFFPVDCPLSPPCLVNSPCQMPSDEFKHYLRNINYFSPKGNLDQITLIILIFTFVNICQNEVLSEESQLMKCVGIFRVGIFWVGIFRWRIFQEGESDGWEFSGWEFSRGEFPGTGQIIDMNIKVISLLKVRILNIIHKHLLKENNYNDQAIELRYRSSPPKQERRVGVKKGRQPPPKGL